MNLEEFIEKNSIAIFVKADFRSKRQYHPQGKTKCVICQINGEQFVALFYDTSMDVKENYLFAKQLDVKMKELLL